jgi:hypothetical protein
MQVHNMGDPPTQLAVAREFKKAGRVRYIGITTTSDSQYPALEQVMRNEPLDFIGIDYAADNRGVEEKILPLAMEKKIGVLAYAPFGRTSLFRRVGTTPLPEFAKEFDATTWAQFFVHSRAPRDYRRDASHQSSQEHDRQHRRRHRSFADRCAPQDDDRVGGRAAGGGRPIGSDRPAPLAAPRERGARNLRVTGIPQRRMAFSAGTNRRRRRAGRATHHLANC